MKELNRNFRFAYSRGSIQPRITIAVHFSENISDIVYFTSHDLIGVPSGAEAYYGTIQNFKGATQKIDPKNSTASIGSISFDLVDIDGQISNLLSDKDAEGKSARKQKCVVYYGAGGFSYPVNGIDGNAVTTPDIPEISQTVMVRSPLDWLDYEQAFTMLVEDYEVGPGVVSFVADDIQRLEQRDLFIPDKTTLLETIDSTQLLIPISENIGTSKFQLVEHDNSYSDRPNVSVGYVRIENEVIAHTGVAFDATLGTVLNGIERGALNTAQAGHAVDPEAGDERKTKVEEFIYLEGPALKLLYAIQTGILHGQSGATLPEHWHQGIDPEFVRLNDYLEADPNLWEPSANTGTKLRFEGLKKENGETFISSQILAWIVGVRPVYSDGSIGFKKLSNVLSGADYVAQLTDDDIVRAGNLSHKYSDVINEYSISWDWDYLTESYLQTNAIIDAASISKYRQGESKRFEFKGVKSSNQTQNDLEALIGGLRNRYAAGGLEWSIEVMPRVNFLEVGDIIRVQTNHIRDPKTAQPIDRSFEVQQITPNTRTGRARLQLFASVEEVAPAEIQPTANSVMNDSWYTSEGTNIASVATIVNDVITADCTLTGGERMGQGIYYYDGNLTIGAGVTVTITDNVWLRIRGVFTRNGNIDGKGRGYAGGQGGTLFVANGLTSIDCSTVFDEYSPSTAAINRDHPILATNETQGIRGYFGNSQAAKYVRTLFRDYSTSTWQTNVYFSLFWFFPPEEVITGHNPTVERQQLFNIGGDDLLNVEWWNLRGTSGSGNAPLLTTDSEIRDIVNIHQAGANGGNGGAGLLITCRGEAVGVSSVIDLSGEDGEYPAMIANPVTDNVSSESYDYDFANGGGGGGQPGALYIHIDGNGLTATNTNNVTQNRGLAGINPAAVNLAQKVGLTNSPDHFLSVLRDDTNEFINFGRALTPEVDAGTNGFKIQFIPPPVGNAPVVINAPKYQLQALNGSLTLESGNDTMLGSHDGTIRERIKVVWPTTTEAQAGGYEVQAKPASDPESEFRTVAVIRDVRRLFTFIDATEGVNYDVRVRVFPEDNTAIASEFITAQHVAVGKSDIPTTPTGLAFQKRDDGTLQISIDKHPDADFLEHIFTENAAWPSGNLLERTPAVIVNLGLRTTGSYEIYAVARDRSGNLSAPINITAVMPEISPVTGLVLTANNLGVLVEVAEHADPDFSSFLFDDDLSDFVRKDANEHQYGFLSVGTHTIGVRAYNNAGDSSARATEQITISAPSQPTVSVSFEGVQYVLTIAAGASTYPVREYRIEYGGDVLGVVSGNRFSAQVDWVGSRVVNVIQIDAAGNESPASSIAIVPNIPGTPAVSGAVIDNNVALRYRSTPGSLPIDHYEVHKGSSFATAQFFDDKAGTSSFTIIQEEIGGTFTYWFVAVDTAGNKSTEGFTTQRVAQPPDFELFSQFASHPTFGGTITNGLIDNSNLYLLFDEDESWSSYASNGYTTFGAEDSAGFEAYLTPGTTSASYVETFDAGSVISNSRITVSVGTTAIDGSPGYTVDIAHSTDNATWTTVTDSQSILAVNFRYVRVTINATGADNDDALRISALNVTLSIKKSLEDGIVAASASDPFGTTVTFEKDWLDVTSISVSAAGTDSRKAIYDFTDEPNPTSMRVFIFDDSGNRLSGDVSYAIRGVLN